MQSAALRSHLHFAGGVGDGAGFFVRGKRGQDHVGHLRRLGQKHVLHDQQIELAAVALRSAFACGDGIAADDPERLQAAAGCSFQHLRAVRPGLSLSVAPQSAAVRFSRGGVAEARRSPGKRSGAIPCRQRRGNWRSRPGP